MNYADIILPVPLNGMFTYIVPDDMINVIKPGMRVLVPFGRSKSYVGIIAEVHNRKPEFQTKNITRVLDEMPMVLPLQFKLWRWISDYYMSPIGDVYKAALPAKMKAVEKYKPKTELYITLCDNFRNESALQIAMGMLSRARVQMKAFSTYLDISGWAEVPYENAECHREITREELSNVSGCTITVINALCERGLLKTYEKQVGRLNNTGTLKTENIKELNDNQMHAIGEIRDLFKEKNVVLLHGVTSSGKTEIYIHLINEVLKTGRQVLYLLPEIALTVQITERLRKVFGDKLCVYHSKYSDDERVEIWQKQVSDNPYQVILGARSSVLLPYQNLGLIIVDEEHETSFKQQDPAPRYHARNVAIVMAAMCGAKTLLGTATPSAESYYNASTGKFGLVKLMHRHKDIKLPETVVVDIADLNRRKMMEGPFSPQLLEAIQHSFDKGKQVILFQNRRGYDTVIECQKCGWVPRCTNCDVSLTYHKNTNQLTCHYCGASYTMPDRCPKCGNAELKGKGYGTEKIENYICRLFPQAKVARMDLDTTRTHNAYERIIDEFSEGKTNLLIGTQMVTKGLDFDKVGVVGILNADSMLNYPDFRAYEHAYCMMAQVSGRAGRKGDRGLVILQTKTPDHPVIEQLVRNDYDAFFNTLMEERQMFGYPPFMHIIDIYIKHKKDDVCSSAACQMGVMLRHLLGERVLGPERPVIARVKTMYIQKIVLKLELGIDLKRVRECLYQIRSQILSQQRYASAVIYYDADPI